MVKPIAFANVALPLRPSSTSEIGPVIVNAELLVSATVWNILPVAMFSMFGPRVMLTKLVTSVAQLQVTKLAVMFCGSSITTVVMVLAGRLTFPDHPAKA